MAHTAAYTGLRQGELFALTIGQVDPAARVIDVDRKVIEVAGQLLTGAPKGRKRRKTIYPARTPHGYPLADKIAARIQQARAEQDAGTNPPGCCSPPPAAPGGGPPTSTAASWPPPTTWPAGATPAATATWTWHSLRHVLCTTALFTWKLDPTDVSAIAGHANIRTTLDMYIGTTAGILDRARTATE